jgi:hypothetical protein
LISSNGYTWSHSNSADNVQPKSFSFTANEIILVEFDPENKEIHFKKKGGANKFKLSIVIPEGEDIHACVNLCNKNEKIEIVTDIDQSEYVF